VKASPEIQHNFIHEDTTGLKQKREHTDGFDQQIGKCSQ